MDTFNKKENQNTIPRREIKKYRTKKKRNNKKKLNICEITYLEN